MVRIGILVGSGRSGGNSTGLTDWVQRQFATTTTAEVTVLTPTQYPYPAGVLTAPEMPALVKNREYSDPETAAFARWVSGCDALVILTPQYNWGYPGSLKNALDRLASEWRGKPFLLITYGGHGGGKAADQLAQVIEGGLKAKVSGRVAISLPDAYIRENVRVGAAGNADGFLEAYEESAKEAILALLQNAT
ncbi:hypothetical protein HK100_004664 [Physocladia obscura]|uniref:NADPH-dependent FMN reductase-like domain-containing protein n=1 Tax=Physocladia obscura TaxID=109957 RepID=A0AAD5SUT3_9FUNG|nr:hypothetical protein HK100_004664 [Physocladia obscura]